MLLAIPLLIKCRVTQTEICRQVNDFRGEFCILLDVVLRLSMRLCQEKDINRFERRRVTEFELCLLA